MINTSNSFSVQKKLSFFLPYYNEEASLKKTVELVLKIAPTLLIEFEIILINDGSNDNSLEIAKALSKNTQQIKVFSFEKNQGFGAAYILGLQQASFDHAMYLSTDGDVNSEELKLILQSWDGNSSLLQYAKNPKIRNYSRYLLSKIYTFMINTLSNSHWPYYNGFNIYSLKNRNLLKSKNFGFATQAYVLLILFKIPTETILLATESIFNDSTSKAISFKNIYNVFLFFCFIIRNKI